MDGLNYMPADGTRAAIKNRGLRHHPDGSSSKNYSVSEGRTGDLSKFKKYFYGAPRSMKMGTIVSLWHYDWRSLATRSNHLVFQRRNAQRPFRPVRLGDVVPSHRRRDIASGFDARQTFELGVWSVIRLCLHPPSYRARRPSPERYLAGADALHRRRPHRTRQQYGRTINLKRIK